MMKLFVIAFFVYVCGMGMLAAGGAQSTTAAAVANGRTIFQTKCVVCHGANGAGGKHLAGGAVSADLRHASLVTHQKHPYTLALLERAISTGVDNEGQKLNPVMPHWHFSARDLHDVATYVYTQLK